MNILVLLPNQVEEIELITPIDIWRRANYSVTIASIDNNLTTISQQGITIIADKLLKDVELDQMDYLFLPGGSGHELLANSSLVNDVIRYFIDNNKIIIAICAAPTILTPWLLDKKATCYPELKHKMSQYSDEKVVIDYPFITSQGAGTASDLAFSLVSLVDGEEMSIKLQQKTLFHL